MTLPWPCLVWLSKKCVWLLKKPAECCALRKGHVTFLPLVAIGREYSSSLRCLLSEIQQIQQKNDLLLGPHKQKQSLTIPIKEALTLFFIALLCRFIFLLHRVCWHTERVVMLCQWKTFFYSSRVCYWAVASFELSFCSFSDALCEQDRMKRHQKRLKKNCSLLEEDYLNLNTISKSVTGLQNMFPICCLYFGRVYSRSRVFT